MGAPAVYVLGGKVEIDLTTYDISGNPFIPNYARISVKDPEGTITTYSGGLGVVNGDLEEGSGYLYVLYRPPVIGWYEHEHWAADGTGREGTDSEGWEVVDRVY